MLPIQAQIQRAQELEQTNRENQRQAAARATGELAVRQRPGGDGSQLDRVRGAVKIASIAERTIFRGSLALGLLFVLMALAPSAEANIVNLHAPEAGITDPLADVVPLDRNCTDHQVDINVASAEEIASGLGISSRPAIDRLISRRPWLKPSDAVSTVLPPSMLPRLERDACASPTTLPMPTPLACRTGSGAVDLQAASARTIVDKLKLPRSVVDDLVGARPLPQDLHQVAAPRTPGLSDPKIDKLLQDGRVCVTPAEFTWKGKTWKFVTEEHGAVVTDAGNSSYALIVPPGNISSPIDTGVWGTVKIIPGTLPRADLHLYGEMIDEVATRLPNISDPHYARPTVAHDAAGGPAFSWGDSVVREPGGTVVAALTSLSPVTSIDLSPLCLSGYDNGSTFCAATSPRDMQLTEILKNSGNYTASYVAALPKPGPCNSSSGAISAGGMPFSTGCYFEGATSTKATWRIANNSGLQTAGGLVTVFGTVANQIPLGNHTHTAGSVQLDTSIYGLFGKPAAEFVAKHGTLLPATSIAISKQRGSGPSLFQHTLPLREHGQWWLLFNALKVVDAGFTLTGVSDAYQAGLLQCFVNVAGTDRVPNPDTIVSCMEPQIEAYLDGFTASAEANGNKTLATKLASAKELMRKAFLAPAGFDAAASTLVQLGGSIGHGTDTLLLDYPPPPPPASGNVGGLAGDGTFIARTPNRKGYLVNPRRGTAAEITNGGDFLCYATARFVIDLVVPFTDGEGIFLNLKKPVKVDNTPAPPCTITAPVWNYLEPPAGNTPFGVVLKGEDDGGVDSAWLITASGEIETIATGGSYIACVDKYPVIWNVPLSKINAWKKVGNKPADCS